LSEDTNSNVQKVKVELTQSAASVLRRWLEMVPIEAVPVTHVADRQALSDLLAALEWSVPEPTQESVEVARKELLKDAGDWVHKGSMYKQSPNK
jgi:hypothetical protein